MEYLDPDIALDSALQRNSGAVTSITGLDHLEAKSVVTVGDGAQYPVATVSSGAITINPSATDIAVGLAFTPTCTLLQPSITLVDGTINSRVSSTGRVVFRVLDFVGLQVGAFRIPPRDSDDLLGFAPAKTTGKIRAPVEGNADTLTFSQYLSIPGKVLSVYRDVDFGET